MAELVEAAFRAAKRDADLFDAYKYDEDLWEVEASIAAQPLATTALAPVCGGLGWLERGGVRCWRGGGDAPYVATLDAADGASFCAAGAGVAAASGAGDLKVAVAGETTTHTLPANATIVAATPAGDRVLVVVPGEPASLAVLSAGALEPVAGSNCDRVLAAAATPAGFAVIADDGDDTVALAVVDRAATSHVLLERALPRVRVCRAAPPAAAEVVAADDVHGAVWAADGGAPRRVSLAPALHHCLAARGADGGLRGAVFADGAAGAAFAFASAKSGLAVFRGDARRGDTKSRPLPCADVLAVAWVDARTLAVLSSAALLVVRLAAAPAARPEPAPAPEAAARRRAAVDALAAIAQDDDW